MMSRDASPVERRTRCRVKENKKKKLEESTNAMVVPIVNHRRKYNNTERKKDNGREKEREGARARAINQIASVDSA